MSSPFDGRIARFGVFDLDTRTGELRKRGMQIHLQEQPFQVLTLLVRRAGDLVSREELRQQLWSDTVFVDFDQGLNTAILKIRLALGDSAESPRFVETLGRRGYRFLASVEWAGLQGAPPSRPRPAEISVRLTIGDSAVPLAAGTHTIGRDPGAEVWIDSPLVSRQHARLVVRDGRVTIEDLGSRNGTYVNGTRLTAVSPLAHRDEIRLGTVQLFIRIASGRTVTAPADDSDE